MINHRIANHWRCLLLLSVTALWFPLASFAQTYTSLATGINGQGFTIPSLALGNNGFAYQLGSILPGQTTAMSQLNVGIGNSDNIQLLGLGRQNGFAYLVGFFDTSGWHAEGMLPGQVTPFSQITAGVGWGQSGNFNISGGGAGNTYSNNFLQVIGLGANDGLAYLAAFQDNQGHWHPGGILPYAQNIPFSELSVVIGSAYQLQVIGRAVSNGQLYLTAFQDTEGNWHAAGLLPGQSPAVSSITTSEGNGTKGTVQVFGLGASDGYIYLPDWQDGDGNWFAAGILPGQSTPLIQMVASVALQGNENSGWYDIVVVGGIGASDHMLHLTDWQDSSGTWHAYASGSVPILQVPVTQVVATGGAFVGLGEDNHIYLLTILYTDGGQIGYDLTPNAGVARWLPAVLQILNGL